MYCTECGAEVAQDDSYCPKCGTDLDAKSDAGEPVEEETEVEYDGKHPWYNRGGLLFVWGVFFFPVALYGLYRNEWMSTTLKQTLGYLAGTLVGAFGLSYFLAITTAGSMSSVPFMLVWGLSVFGLLGMTIVGLFSPSTVFWWREKPSRSLVFSVAGSVFLLVSFLGFPLSMIPSMVALEQRTTNRYEANRETVLGVVDSLLTEEKPERALDTINTYQTSFASQPRLDSLKGVARADTLYQSVLQIPASDYEANIDAYKQLTELDSNRELFQKKLERYRSLKEQREQEARKEYKYSDAWADKNSTTAWFMCQDFVEKRLKAPSTAEFPWQSEASVRYLGEGEFVIGAHVDAENAFGAKIREQFTCQIQHDEGKRWKLLSLNMQ